MLTPIEPGDAVHLEHFMMRVVEAFPEYCSGEWSPLERGVFNGLLTNAVRRHGSEAVTGEVLDSIRVDMAHVIRQYTSWQSGQ
jgi:hypothetical protein